LLILITKTTTTMKLITINVIFMFSTGLKIIGPEASKP